MQALEHQELTHPTHVQNQEVALDASALGENSSAAAAECKDASEQNYLQTLMTKYGVEGSHLVLGHLFDSSEIPRLATALKADTTVTRLYIVGLHLDLKAVTAIAEIIEHNTNLEKIALTNNNLGPDEAVILAAALEKNTTLQALSLIGNSLGDEGAIALAKALEKNTTLQQLNLGKNEGISHSGITAIAKALQINTTLEYMNLEPRYRDDTPEEKSLLKEMRATLSANKKSWEERRENYDEELPSVVEDTTKMPTAMAEIIQGYVGKVGSLSQHEQRALREDVLKERTLKKQVLEERVTALKNSFLQLEEKTAAVITSMQANPLYKPSSNKLKTVQMLQTVFKTYILPKDDAALENDLPRYQHLLVRSIALASIIIGYNTKGSRAARFGQFFKAPKEATEIPLFNTWLQFQDPSLTLPIEVVTADLRAALAASIKEVGVLDAQKPFKSLLERIQEHTAHGKNDEAVLFELICFGSNNVEQSLSAQALPY